MISWDLQFVLILYIRMDQLKGMSVEIKTTDAVEWRVNIVLFLSSYDRGFFSANMELFLVGRISSGRILSTLSG